MTEREMSVGGGVIYWSLTQESSRAALEEAWDKLGYKSYVPEPRPKSAVLKEALQDSFPDHLIRSLESRDGYCAVKEHKGIDRNIYVTVLAAHIDDQAVITFDPDTDSTPVVEAYNRQLGIITGSQVGTAMVKILESMGGVRLRPSGAIYWLPIGRLWDWQAVADAVESAALNGKSACYILRNRMDADAARAVQNAITTEIMYQLEEIQKAIESEVGARALENRRVLAEQLRVKIHSYEGILNTGLIHLRQAVDETEIAIGKAAILAAAMQEKSVA